MIYPDMTIRTPRIVLRPVEATDAEAVAGYVSDWDVASMTANIPHPYSLDDARAWIARDVPRERYAITLDGALIGAIAAVPKTDGALEIGYWLGKPHWGHGYMTEAAAALIERLRDRDPGQRILIGHLLFNSRSRRVIEKLGFRHVGNRPQVSVSMQRELAVAHYELPFPSEATP